MAILLNMLMALLTSSLKELMTYANQPTVPICSSLFRSLFDVFVNGKNLQVHLHREDTWVTTNLYFLPLSTTSTNMQLAHMMKFY